LQLLQLLLRRPNCLQQSLEIHVNSRGATTFRIMTFSITTLSIISLFATLSINDIQHYGYRVPSAVNLSTAFYHCYADCHYAECRYAECRGATLRVEQLKVLLGFSALRIGSYPYSNVRKHSSLKLPNESWRKISFKPFRLDVIGAAKSFVAIHKIVDLIL